MKKFLAITLLAGGLLGAGCGDNREDFVITNNTNVTVAPVCQDDAYTTNQNTPLVVNAANGVLANDVRNGANLTFTATSTQNGTVAMNQDGSFTYTPATDFNGTDTFTYTLTNPGGSRTCTVTITVTAVNGFFVDATNGNDGTGSFTNGRPFATIQGAVNAAGINDTIVVRPGSYTGAVNLKNGQRLVGSGSTLVNAQGAVRPSLTGPVVLADGNTLDFLRIAGTNGDAVDGNGQNGGTVTNCEVADSTAGANGGDGLSVLDCQGNWTVSSNSFVNLAGSAVGFQTLNTATATFVVVGNTMTSNGGAALIFVTEDTSDVRASVVGNVMRGNNLVTGDAFELICGDDSSFCLDLEDNVNDTDTNSANGADGVYSLLESPFGTLNELKVEQLNVLTLAKPGGAGNTGVVDDNSGIGGETIEDVADGFCGF